MKHLAPRRQHALRSALVIGLLAGPITTPRADTLLQHGHIYTGNPAHPWAESLLVSGTRIAAVGTDSEVRKVTKPQATRIELHGRTVIPGIVDSHVHVLFGAFALHGLNLSVPEASVTVDKPELLVARLRALAAAHPADPVLFARADFSMTPPTTPGSGILDRAVPDRPLVIHNTAEHALWVNTAAVKMAGVSDYPVPDPQEERSIVRDASGHPTGVFLEASMEVIERSVAARVPKEDLLAMLEAAGHYLNSYGITSVVNATGSLDELRLYGMLRDRSRLTIRTRTSFGAVAYPHHLTPQFLSDLEEARTLYHDEWVSANLVKFFADGATGLVPPLVYEPHEYAALVKELDRRGFQLMTHAARNDSVHMILDAYEQLEMANGPRDRRLRIEHADLTDAADIARFAKLSVIVDMQPAFCCGEQGLNYDVANPMPTERWKSFEDSGTTLAFSSDWPCTWPPSPFVGIEQSVTRDAWRSEDTGGIVGNPFDGAGQGGARKLGKSYVPAERLTVGEAVAAYTRGSAYAAFADAQVGTLEAGKLADLAVLSQDIFSVPPDVISNTRVELTMVGGKIVYTAEQ